MNSTELLKTPVFVVGYPGDIGGANTECWHTVKLWRRFGLEVRLIPTGQPSAAWRARLDRIGCQTVCAAMEELKGVPGLPGGIVVSFCNAGFLKHADRFRELGCRLVWVNCMTWLFAEERRHYQRLGPFDRYVFQSRHQESALGPQLAKFGVRPAQCFLIRGAFSLEEFPFRPLGHAPGTPLVIGRISRAAADKYSASTWAIYRRIPHPIRARLMGWSQDVQRKLGQAPPWAECLPAGAETPQEFFSKLHCMVQVNGGAEENWPRSGLEAMASGVAIVAQNHWGWREMVRHGQTGLLADGEDQLAYYAARLAYDEPLRMEMVRRARAVLEQELANPKVIWAGWRELFASLADGA
ncbi:MAG: glycosyltransferase [Thermoguttaceae bacterium]